MGGAVNDDAFLACVRVDVRVVGAGVGAGAGGGLSAIPVEGGLVDVDRRSNQRLL